MFSKIILNTTFLLFVLTAFAQTDSGEKVHTKLIKVKNNIYMLQGNGGNIGLSFGNDGVFMIDDQFADGIEQIQKDIKKVSDKPVRLLVNTHFHGDHTGGNAAMAATGTVIFSQENVRDRILGMVESEKTKISDKSLPIVTFSEDLTFHFNGEKIYVFHVHNAHTDGDAMVYFTKNNVLHTGDVFFNGKYPFIDVENGGSLKGCIEGLEKALLVINEDTKIIPGHGNMGTPKDISKTLDMINTIYKRVYKNYVNKKSEAEVSKMTDLTKEFDELGYGSGFINTEAFLKMIYGEVAKERGDIEANAEKNAKAREKVEKMMKEQEKKGKN
ncbi:Zn-dependent hydrolase, glyoxylase [Aequorivita sublithincola DSM 14238]|uniref:Zn-dependent hydrolase, glyoxylase n=1 Tax=Aequorivita sublithincola (strain DSM 14238 / LMG 21431 / ACAM 643 / 9-3) TaxID=746697 RepID=I3YTR5_AEQSU|nr:MBL fold metallo-hydrolase [Aequorivita sublithincola]AFL80383.1 Zn-dependent hydrolase, glyoxylase [Aequorivita sublithincola DSM 14238]